MNKLKEQVVSKTEEKVPITAINSPIDFAEKPTFISKSKNAIKMLYKDGFGSFSHKIKRRIYHHKQFLMRRLFHPNEGQLLRETAKKHFSGGNKLPTLSIVVTALKLNELVKLCLSKLTTNQIGEIEIVLMNGGDTPIEMSEMPNNLKNVKIVQDTEVYPAFKFWMENTTGDIMLFIHDDLIINEKGFDLLLRYAFEKDPKLGLVGFVGSDELNEKGSRGWGTTSNFMGKTYSYEGKTWVGSKAELWGSRYDALTPAVMIDGCAMAIRRSVWNKLGFHRNQSMYYYYDRLMCCRVLEAGYRIATLGLDCDHISNQTASKQIKYHHKIHMLCEKYNVPPVTDVTGNVNWDISLHAEAKRRFLREWRDEKHFIPRKIGQWL